MGIELELAVLLPVCRDRSKHIRPVRNRDARDPQDREVVRYAKATSRKDRRLNIRLSSKDLE